MTTIKEMTVPQSRWKKIKRTQKAGWLIGGVLILLAAFTAYSYYTNTQASAQTAVESELQTATVRQGDLVIYANGSGTLISKSDASFGFSTSGQVTEVFVNVGDQVESGQVLAELNNTSAQLNYEQAKRALAELTSPAAIATARQTLALAEDTLATEKVELEYLISPSVLTWEERTVVAQEALIAAQAEDSANSTSETQQKLKDAEFALKLAEANLRSANAAYDSYVKEHFTETETNPFTGEERVVYYIDEETGKRYTVVYAPTKAEIDAARASYELAKASLAEAQDYLAALNGQEIPATATGSALSELQNARGTLTEAQNSLTDTQLISPISGTIMSLDFSVGDIVSGSSAVATISDLSQPYLEVFLDESDWANIRAGYDAEITFDILPERIFNGMVVQVDPGLYTESGTSVVRALVQLENVDTTLDLPFGTSAAVDVIGGRAENVALVPIEALRETSPGEYAVFVLEDGEPRLRMVEVGIRDLLFAEVKSGLQAGEVVTTGITETE
jgi:HlyD family secretion protein